MMLGPRTSQEIHPLLQQRTDPEDHESGEEEPDAETEQDRESHSPAGRCS